MRYFDRKAILTLLQAASLSLFGLAFSALVFSGLVFSGFTPAYAQTTLRIFVGGQQRSDLMHRIAEDYTKANPDIRVEIETGGATAEQQSRYLNGVFTSKVPTIDLILVDVIRPAQLAAAQWIEPFDAYLGAEKEAIMARYLPGYRAASVVNGKVVALPFHADALFLYYRKDMLAKYGLQPPTTWDALKTAALKVLDGENTPNLVGFEAAGAPVESAVCSYLVPMWGSGEDILSHGKLNLGKLNLAGEAAQRPFRLWMELKAAKVTPPDLADIATDRIRQNFQAGTLVFGMTWGYAWNRAQNDPDSRVKNQFGVVPPPGFSAGSPATCLGGWQIALSAFSHNKTEAVKLARFLSSPETSKMQATMAGRLPVFTSLYSDAAVVAANPWFAEAFPVMLSARARPMSPRYAEVSEIIRSSLHACLAGTKTAEAALADMRLRLEAIFR